MGLSSLVTFTFVCDLFLLDTRVWYVHLVMSIFNQDTANVILNMTMPSTGEDYLIWIPDSKGKFSAKSAYNILCTNYVNNFV